MNVVLTYDPRWTYTSADNTALWASLDTVDFVAGMLTDLGNDITCIKADDSFEDTLREIKVEYPETIVFWLNEFMPIDNGRDIFTVEIIEKLKMMHTGPGSGPLRIGLDKEKTKEVFHSLGLQTPESFVVNPGKCSVIYQSSPWNGDALIKPLLQGNSRGLNESSVVPADDFEAIREIVEQIHQEFNQPALVEEYIGGTDAKEYSAPAIISHDGKIGHLPLVEIDLSQIPLAQGKFSYLTTTIKKARTT